MSKRLIISWPEHIDNLPWTAAFHTEVLFNSARSNWLRQRDQCMIVLNDLYEKINLLCMFFLIRTLWTRFIKVPPLAILAFQQLALVSCVLPSHASFTVHAPPSHFWTELDPRWNELNIFLNILAYQKCCLHDVRLKACTKRLKMISHNLM